MIEIITHHHIMTIQIDSSILELFLPNETLQWFDLVRGEKNNDEVQITLEEKNIPPLTAAHEHKTICSKGFTDITVSDFPIRGKRTLLTFRRRRWQVDGAQQLLKRDIKLVFPGTQLEIEFASFLKDGSRD